MAIIFFDGFDGYDTSSDLAYGGWSSLITQSLAISSATRFGTGKCLHYNITGANQSASCTYTFPSQAGKDIYIGFALCPITPVEGRVIVGIGGQCGLQFTASGSNWKLRAFASGTLATGTTELATNVWKWIECKILVSNTGTFELKIDGVTEFTFSGDTQILSTDVVTYVQVPAPSVNSLQSYKLDDLYCASYTVGAGAYLGEVTCTQLPLTGDSSIQWSPSTPAVSNYSRISEALGAPDDTSYVYSNTATNKDEYVLTDIVNPSVVHSVKINTRAQKDNANAKSFKNGIKTGVTDQQVEHTLGIGYFNYIDFFDTSDGVSTAWDSTTLNASLSTIEVV